MCMAVFLCLYLFLVVLVYMNWFCGVFLYMFFCRFFTELCFALKGES